MAKSYLDKDGLLYFLQQIRPNQEPKMDGAQSAIGTAKRFANQDHVHPSDTTKADKSATVSNVAWDSTNKKLTKTINGTTSDVVTTATIKTAIGSATTSGDGLMTTAQVTKLNGIAAGAEVNQNAFSNVKVGSTTIEADAKTDTLELVAGSNVTLTPDATNDKVTIAATNTTYSAGTAALLSAGTDTANRVWQAKILHDYVNGLLPEVEVFVAEYGVTTHAEALAAYNAGKILFCA